MISQRVLDAFSIIPMSDDERGVVRALARFVEAAEWISGRDDTKPYCTYYWRTLEDGTHVPTVIEIAEQALDELELALKGCGV